MGARSWLADRGLTIGINLVDTYQGVVDGGRDSHGNAVVVVGEGTGIVHSAPGCGDIDHEVGKALGLDLVEVKNWNCCGASTCSRGCPRGRRW